MTDQPPAAAPRPASVSPLRLLRRYPPSAVLRILLYSMALLVFTLCRWPVCWLHIRALRRRAKQGGAHKPGIFFYRSFKFDQ